MLSNDEIDDVLNKIGEDYDTLCEQIDSGFSDPSVLLSAVYRMEGSLLELRKQYETEIVMDEY